jgi:hypothetical protein
MANTAKPTREQERLLEELRQAATLRTESYRFYLAVFAQALNAGTGPSLIARYAGISPQAANSMRVRLTARPPDPDAPTTINDVIGRLPLQVTDHPNRNS